MNIERLNDMADMLDEIAAGAWRADKVFPGKQYTFDLNYWRLDRAVTSDNEDIFCKGGCGFVACAIGHATLDKRFSLAMFGGWPVWENRAGWRAVKAYFDIPLDDAVYLFDGSAYDTRAQTEDPRVVAERVRWYIAQGQPS